jgi:tetratricopeptide (TPR) repeat protein
VGWAERQIGGIGVVVSNRAVPLSFEADANAAFLQGQWTTSYRNALRWIDDQPFSTRPVILATYLSSTILEDYAASIDILEKALGINPGNPVLINNLAFAQANLGNLEDAMTTLNSIKDRPVPELYAVPLLATEGLIQMRMKQFDKGRSLYRDALDRASRVSIPRYRVGAAIHLALEEAIGRTSEAPGALKFAEKAAADLHDPDITLLLSRARDLQREAATALLNGNQFPL